MVYLGTKKMVHRDLAARNVLVATLVTGVPQVKVADFGMARLFQENKDYYPVQGAGR